MCAVKPFGIWITDDVIWICHMQLVMLDFSLKIISTEIIFNN
uniref:Uncharacterized protein n=1 Tax=Arundo donax TaxID=35708 RepID=A0A0A9E625_ARUDO